MHGIMLCGAVDELHARGMLSGMRTFVGSSIGAVCGAALALGASPRALSAMFRTVVCELGVEVPSQVGTLGVALGGLGAMDGASKRDAIAWVLSNAGHRPETLTFRRMLARTGRTLVVCGSNVTTGRVDVYSPETTPRMLVLDALEISTCVPLVFRPVDRDGCLLLDGGVFNHLPVDLAPDPSTALALNIERRRARFEVRSVLHLARALVLGLGSQAAASRACLAGLTLALHSDLPTSLFGDRGGLGGRRRLPASVFDELLRQGRLQAGEGLDREAARAAACAAAGRVMPGPTAEHTGTPTASPPPAGGATATPPARRT
jgi:predicted acylesterase/phospholipase RssA